VQLIIEDALPGATCSTCGKKQECFAMTFGHGPLQGSLVLCWACGDFAATAIQNRLWRNRRIMPSREELTSDLVVKFSTCTLDSLLDELVMETTRYIIGPLVADERRVAIALLERLDTLGIAHKVHRPGCEIWPKYRLCDCPWRVPS
jgi:uncharacterized Zn finger protein